MIKFFRKIRQKQLSENKFSKYLIYAIGEIILVVIGILIALQINNWNESRKNKAFVSSYKKSLIENLKMDSLSINKTVFFIETELNELMEFERRVSVSSMPFDTILKIARYEYEFTIAIQNSYQNDTYQVLNSTGHIGLFNTDIIKDLKILYNLQDRALLSNSNTQEAYRNGLGQYSQKYPFSFKTNLIQNGTIASDEVWNNISLSNHATQFNALVITKGDSYRLSMRFLPIILDKTNEMLAKLRDQK